MPHLWLSHLVILIQWSSQSLLLSMLFSMSNVSHKRFRDVSIYLVRMFSSICLVKMFSSICLVKSALPYARFIHWFWGLENYCQWARLRRCRAWTSSSHLQSWCFRQFIWSLQFLFSRTTVASTLDRSLIAFRLSCRAWLNSQIETWSQWEESTIERYAAFAQWLTWLSLRRQNRWSERTVRPLIRFWWHVCTWSMISESD
jgi:hypothetical protein